MEFQDMLGAASHPMNPLNTLFIIAGAIATVFAHAAGSGGSAVRFATRADAEALVTRAIEELTTDRSATLREINAKDKKWVDSDLYPTVYDVNGTCLAHGFNARQVGKRLLDLGDADGKRYIRERVELAKNQTRFWQDYRFPDPISRKPLPKSAYCETVGELIVCAGVYRR